MSHNILRLCSTAMAQWVKRQVPLVTNSAMFASFLTLGDYLAVQLDQKLNEKPKHHPVHRTNYHDSMALAIPNHYHHQQGHHLKTDSTIISNALMPQNFSNKKHQSSTSTPPPSNDSGLLHKLTCVFKSGVIIGALNHYWYVLLDNRFVGTSGKVVALKVFLDQLISSNLTNIGFFLTCGFFEGKTPAQCVNDMSAKYLFLYISDCFFWIPAQSANFKYVPSRYRVAYVSLATVIWNIFLCAHRNNDLHAILLKPPQRQQHAQAQLHIA